MRRLLPIAVLLVAGCADSGDLPSGPREDMFAATAVKIHPVFTRITDWTGDGKLDGIDALIELRDQFGDTTKGAGTFTFELFEVRNDRPDSKGRRVSDPWNAQVITADQQRARWSKTSRCYTFRLQSAEAARGSHMLTVTYAPAGGGPAVIRFGRAYRAVDRRPGRFDDATDADAGSDGEAEPAVDAVNVRPEESPTFA